MPKEHPAPSTFHFRRSKTAAVIEVLNDAAYVVAEYSELTGVVKWHRVVGAPQRDKIEKWLDEHFPPKSPSKKPDHAPRAGRVRVRNPGGNHQVHRT